MPKSMDTTITQTSIRMPRQNLAWLRYRSTKEKKTNIDLINILLARYHEECQAEDPGQPPIVAFADF